MGKSKNVAKVNGKPEALKVSVKEKNGVHCCELVATNKNMPSLTLASGFKGSDTAGNLIRLGMEVAASLLNNTDDLEVLTNNYLGMMIELKPKDGFEGMLMNNMVATFNQAMHYFQLANVPGNRGSTEIQDSIMNRAIKLMRLYNQQLETLDKHRNKGKQKMTVEHVHVYKGGQAIVGEVHQGGVNEKK